MNKLKQKKNFVKREFRFTDSKLFYNVSKFGNENEIDIPFENINGEKVSYKSANSTTLVISISIFLIAALVEISYLKSENGANSTPLFFAGIAAIFLILYILNRNDFWKIRLVDDSYLYIHKSIPSPLVADQFIEGLMEARNEYLRENYATVDENLPYESQLNNLKWLKSLSAISKDEFEVKYIELKRVVNPDKPKIGFGK